MDAIKRLKRISDELKEISKSYIKTTETARTTQELDYCDEMACLIMEANRTLKKAIIKGDCHIEDIIFGVKE